MRITLTRSGGFAGILPPPVTLDTAALPRGVARRIEELVASADFFNLPHTLAAPNQALEPTPNSFVSLRAILRTFFE